MTLIHSASNPSRADAARPGTAADSAARPAGPAPREIFKKLPGPGPEDGQRAPEIYPVLQLQASGHSVERCGVCLMAKERCAC